MVEETPAGRSWVLWVLWALAVAGLGILTGVLILGVASARLEPGALRSRRVLAVLLYLRG